MKRNIFLSVAMILVLCITLSGCAQTSNVNYVPANKAQNNTNTNNSTITNTNNSNQSGNAVNTSNASNNANNADNIPDIWIITKTEEINYFGELTGIRRTYDYNEYGEIIRRSVTSAAQPDFSEITDYIFSYDDSGRKLSLIVTGPGGSDEYIYEYDEEILSHEFRTHTNSEGAVENTYDTTYSKSGNKSFNIESRYNKDGEVTYRAETSYEYDKEGNLIKEDTKMVTEGEERIITYTYDERGNKISQDVEPADELYSDEDYVYNYSYDGKLTKITKTVHTEEKDILTDYIYDYTYYGTLFRESYFTYDVSEAWNVTEYDDQGHEVLRYRTAYIGGPALESTLRRITWMRLSDYLAAKQTENTAVSN